MLGYYDYTVLATYASLAVSVLGVFFAWDGATLSAVLCLMLSGFLDCFDGKIARTKKNRSDGGKRFGIQIDSLCDLVCFGVLPVAVCRSAGLSRGWFTLIGAAYILCALIRLAYFNVTEEERQATTSERRHFYMGLPVTSIALTLPAVYLLRQVSMDALRLGLAILLAVTAALFITPLRIPKFHKAGVVGLVLLGLAEGILLHICR